MLNEVTLIGRLACDPVFKEVSNGKSVCEIVLAISRPFKNQRNHTYDVDYIKVTFWEYLAININEYCIKGCTVSVKARLQVRTITIGEKNIDILDVIGEQIIFICKPHKRNDSKDDEVVEDIPFDEIKDAEL